MSAKYDRVSKNIINNLPIINQVLENSKIESKVLSPAFTEKLEKLKSLVDEEANSLTCQLSPSLNSSENVRQYSRQEINAAFACIKALPEEFAPPKESVKKPVVGKTVVSRSNPNITRVASLQNFSSTIRPSSRTNSMLDIATDTAPKAPKLEELLKIIDQNKKMLEGIKSCTIKYPETTNFGEEHFKLAMQHKCALAEITELVNNLENTVKAIDKDDVDVALDEELNELLEKFTKVRFIFSRLSNLIR